ncbi:MAG: Na/Pi symporter [Sulfurimonas sp.]|uniref:Na/Pi cotransporter family protein n=1 Tax=Sulfurimonas sp. TaxID=2022749 RepID=UPI002629D1C1|nr:Na/Pi symporter [Sulfurimonas sp.]MDD2652872.1 Na/Pi symporter [Sulfurimonas sp.]MDD3452318.1 Na/Pi symporter [Sulfurimonas sp.]
MMLRKYYFQFFLLSLAFVLFYGEDYRIIIAGIAIFLVGMLFMEEGFKLFSGGVLERALQVSTDTLLKAIGTGFAATAIMQSSSLVSVIVISFLSAELITLSGAVGVIFGSNIGTTATAWIVSAFGVKIDIATFAMPMIIFGVVLKFAQDKSYLGFGKILLGLGFVFLGIDYMKDGFEVLQQTFDMSKFAVEGYLGALVYISLGIVATVIMQSSSATMAIIITALATNQIVYINALELAIGANVGTTITAVLGSISSNSNGKRVALAHFIFNVTTATVAVVLLYPLSDLTVFLASKIGIADSDYAMKLALFHTIFNIMGVLLVAPFTQKLVKYLETLFIEVNIYALKPLYLDKVVINVPDAAIEAIKKETIRLYESAIEAIAHSISLHRHMFIKSPDIANVVKNSEISINADIDEFYANKIKSLYSDIIHYATLSQENMNQESQNRVYELKLASRDIVEAIKNMRDLQKNIFYYSKSKNIYVKDEYNTIRIYIAKTIDAIEKLKEHADDLDVLFAIELLKESTKALESIKNSRIDTLIRESKVDAKMATSLINDSAFAYDVTQKLVHAATILWIKDKDIRTLGGEK